MSTKIISVRQLRPKLSSVLEEVSAKLNRYLILRRSEPKAILLSIDEYESLMETLEIQSDKECMKRLKKAEADLAAGKGEPLEQIKKELGLV